MTGASANLPIALSVSLPRVKGRDQIRLKTRHFTVCILRKDKEIYEKKREPVHCISVHSYQGALKVHVCRNLRPSHGSLD
jgi:hypothetical protein